MGKSERRKKERERRRCDIIRAAEKLFVSRGYDNTRIDDIADEADFSKRTIYKYFQSKKEIFLTFVTLGFKKLNSIIIEMEERETPNDALQRLRVMTAAYISFYEQYPAYFEAIIEYENEEIDFEGNSTTIQNCYNEGENVLNYLIDILKEGVRDGSFRKDLKVVETALILWANIIGYVTVMNKKKNYIKNYHQKDIIKMQDDFFAFNLAAIVNGSN